jgi:hypothetical protein
MNGLPGLRLLPDAPHPGRSHRTHQPRRQTQPEAGQGTRQHLAAFHTGYKSDRGAQPAAAKSDQDQRTLPKRGGSEELIYLSIINATPKWTQVAGWTKALLAFKIHFGDRLPD